MGGLSMKQFNLEEYLKDPSKKIVTRDGRNVTIHCTNCVGFRPVIAEIEGEDYSLDFNKNGIHYCGVSNDDLFFAPENTERWVNLYYDKIRNKVYFGKIFKTKEKAKNMGKSQNNYVITIPIEQEDQL